MTYQDVEDGLLVLPFTPGLLRNPLPLLPIVYKAAHHARNSLTVLFSTPQEEGIPKPRQMYYILRRSPKTHFAALQSFLGKVYSALAAGQWAAGRVLLEVEVRFDGEKGDWKEKIVEPHGLMVLQGFEHIAHDIVSQVAPSLQPTVIPAPASLPDGQTLPGDEGGYPVSAVGGTFDHLHAAHKLLLHMSLFVTEKRLIVGVVSDKLLPTKTHAAHLQSLDVRLAAINEFLKRCGPGKVTLDVVEIHDALGPTAWDPEITALTVSRETAAGGREVNRVRREKGLNTLETLCVDVISSTVVDDSGDGLTTLDLTKVEDSELKELKLGSTAIRSWKAQAANK